MDANKTTSSKRKLYLTIAIAVGLIVLVSGFVIVSSFAGGFFASLSAGQSTIAGNAKIVTDTGTADGKALQFTAPATIPPTTPTQPPTGSTTCPLPKYPSDACTGVPSTAKLMTVNGDYNAKAGEVIDSKNVTGNIIINGNDVVIRNSRIGGKVDNESSRASFTIEDSTVGLDSGCGSISDGLVGVANFTARRLRIKGQPDGFRVAGSNVLIEDSYITVCSKNPDDHSDGLQVYGAANAKNIVIRHNVFDQRPVTNGAATAPIFIPTDADRQGNNGVTVTVTDNVVAGGGFGFRIYGTLPLTAYVTGNKVVNNTWGYGPVDVTCDKIKSWSGNAVITYDWASGTILSQVRALTDCN